PNRCFHTDSYAPLQSPPSFPTRRSSDLEQAEREPQDGVAPDLGRCGIDDRLARQQVRSCEAADELLLLLDRRVERVGERHAARRDRKSTRLNSSHLGISYAVFCLKKKKH